VYINVLGSCLGHSYASPFPFCVPPPAPSRSFTTHLLVWHMGASPCDSCCVSHACVCACVYACECVHVCMCVLCVCVHACASLVSWTSCLFFHVHRWCWHQPLPNSRCVYVCVCICGYTIVYVWKAGLTGAKNVLYILLAFCVRTSDEVPARRRFDGRNWAALKSGAGCCEPYLRVCVCISEPVNCGPKSSCSLGAQSAWVCRSDVC
jgi:hypothetical protein